MPNPCRKLLLGYFNIMEPEAVLRRKAKRFKRKRYWAAGLNDVWCFDQHDKWKRFGLYFHQGYEVCGGRILHIKVWWTNRNPRLIAGYYLDDARRAKG